MDCALRIKQKYSPAPDQIAEVICRTAEGPVHRLWEPLPDKQKPATSYGAKFSLPYSIAVMLIRGQAGLEEFSEAAIHDPELLELASKVRYDLDPTIDYPRHFEGHVQVRMKNGSVFAEDQLHPRGGYEDPLPPEEIETKFRANARLALADSRIEEVIKLVQRLEQLPAISRLTEALIP
jgi:2-methylcitrate dehydratase PrpD